MSADPGTAELVRAVGASDVDGVRRALAAGASPDAPDGAGRPLFAAIVSWATPEIVQLFVEAGARIPCEPDGAGWTFAHAAATRGDDALMAEVLRRGVALDARWEVSLMTPLETAAWYGHERCVALLLAAGASAAAGAGLPSAHGRATMRGHAAIVALLEAHGVHATVDESSPWPPRDWDDVPGWDKWARFAIARARSSTTDLLPLADTSIARALWRPRGPKRRVLVLGPGISLLPRLLMLGGDDVVAIDRSPVAVAFGRENKLHRSQVEWFFSTLDEGRELAPVRGAVAWEVGDARDANAALGPFEHVVATALLHGFGDEERRRILANAAAWLGAGGVFHVGLYGGSQVAAKLEADAASAGLALDDASEGRRLRLWCFGSG